MNVKVTLKDLRSLGLGDLVKKTTQALGIKATDCKGCEKRRQALNRFRLPK